MADRTVVETVAPAEAGAAESSLPRAAQRLPMDGVYVVKLSDAMAGTGARCRGQLEHVASGRRQHFSSARELIKVLRRGLGEPA
jgi:hypothetical protein